MKERLKMKDFILNPEKVFGLIIKLIEDQENVKINYELKKKDEKCGSAA